MTHQQMIDYWQGQIDKYKQGLSLLLTKEMRGKYEALLTQSHTIYLQLCTMDTVEPKTETATEYKPTIVAI